MTTRLAIDLGTTHIRVAVPKKGIILSEPSVVAIQASNGKVVAIGREAREMVGRTPESIIAASPLREGVIANYRIAEEILSHAMNSALGPIRLVRPEVMLPVPAGATSTERRAVVDAAIAAGARSAYVIKSSIAAALGAGLSIASSSGTMIIDIGGGTTETAVIALGDTVAVNSVRIGSETFDAAITSHVRKKHNLIIGEQTASEIKREVGAAVPLKKELTMEVSGSNSVTGLPESMILSTSDVLTAIKPVLSDIMNAVKVVLQNTPPELAADVMDKGIMITGGGAKLRGLDELFTKITGVPCQVAENPEECVVKGTLIAVEHLDAFKKSVLWAR